MKNAALLTFLLTTLTLPALAVGATKSGLGPPPTVLLQFSFVVPHNRWDPKPSFVPELVLSCDVEAKGKPKNVLLVASCGNATIDKVAREAMRQMPFPILPAGSANRHYVYLCIGTELPPDGPQPAPPPLPKFGLGIPSNLWNLNPSHDMVVAFDVGADGKPKNIVLKEFSGNDTVDKMAVEAAGRLHLPPVGNGPVNRHLTFVCEVFRQ